jgi:hypothetical protein
MLCKSWIGPESAGWRRSSIGTKASCFRGKDTPKPPRNCIARPSIAEEQEAKLWQLRASTSLARLRLDQGRRAEAGERAAPIYGWFTEGFDTPDLREAKALLDALGWGDGGIPT